MADAEALVLSLFPTAKITSTKRSPMSKLGRANPRSYHNIGKAIDIAPIPGVKFKDYVRSLEGAGLKIIEALEEVGSKRSKHATGNHWHIAYEDDIPAKKTAPEAPKPVQMASMDVEEPDMPNAPEFDVAAETESNFASLLAGLGKKKRKGKKKLPGILDGIV